MAASSGVGAGRQHAAAALGELSRPEGSKHLQVTCSTTVWQLGILPNFLLFAAQWFLRGKAVGNCRATASWQGLLSLFNQTDLCCGVVGRCPGLAYAAALSVRIQVAAPQGADQLLRLSRSFYLLNPDGDLAATQQTLQETLEQMCQQVGQAAVSQLFSSAADRWQLKQRQHRAPRTLCNSLLLPRSASRGIVLQPGCVSCLHTCDTFWWSKK